MITRIKKRFPDRNYSARHALLVFKQSEYHEVLICERLPNSQDPERIIPPPKRGRPPNKHKEQTQ